VRVHSVAQSLNDKFNNINMKKREIEKKSDNVKKKTCEKGDVEQYIDYMSLKVGSK
jgi:hypothetical protein